MKKSLFALLAGCLLAVPALAFDAQQKAYVQEQAIRSAVARAAAEFKADRKIGPRTVTVLPLWGADATTEQKDLAKRLLVDALKKAGKSCVLPNEQDDKRVAKILDTIAWNEDARRLDIVNPKTVAELGSLKSTQVFLEVHLGLSQIRRRATAQLQIAALEVATKEILATWDVKPLSEEIAGRPLPEPVILADKFPLNVKIACEGPANEDSAAVAQLLQSALDEQVIVRRLGVIDPAGAPDVFASVTPVCETVDSEGAFVRLRATTRVVVRVGGPDGRKLGDVVVTTPPVRGFGRVPAAKAIAAQAQKDIAIWLEKKLAGETSGLQALEFLLVGDPVQTATDLAPSEAVRKAIAGMDGVSAAVLMKQNNVKGAFLYRVVYDRAKFPQGMLNAAFLAFPDLFKPFE